MANDLAGPKKVPGIAAKVKAEGVKRMRTQPGPRIRTLPNKSVADLRQFFTRRALQARANLCLKGVHIQGVQVVP